MQIGKPIRIKTKHNSGVYVPYYSALFVAVIDCIVRWRVSVCNPLDDAGHGCGIRVYGLMANSRVNSV